LSISNLCESHWVETGRITIMKKHEKLIICAALAGGATTKNNNPNVPYTPEEFAEESYRCYQEGASIVHLHAKDLNTGFGTMDIEAHQKMYEAVCMKCPELIVNISTGSMTDTPEVRIKPIEVLKPEMCSFNTNSMNFAIVDYKKGEVAVEFIYQNTFKDQVFWAKKMLEAGSRPEFEIFDQGGLNNILILSKQKGLFNPPLNFQFVYGVAGGMIFDPMLHLSLVNLLPEKATYSVCGVGPHQIPAAFLSIIDGGHVRVGLEDNVRMPDNSLARGSWDQVILVRDLAKIAGREIASPDEARMILGLKG
jgi:3-keto-5-aminohexanoate cleavage enzyme